MQIDNFVLMFCGNMLLPCSVWLNLVQVDAEVIGREKWIVRIVASQSCGKGSRADTQPVGV
jgi:hypothetical protein